MLLVQVDAAINAGNSGGPVVTAGKLAGISTQTLEDAENIGDIVPAPVVRHFLEDVADGRFDGFPELGVYVQTLENPALRAHLGLTPDSGGVLVTAVSRSGSASGVLEPGDVLLAVNGTPIRENNTVLLETGVEIDATMLEHSAQVGDKISVTLLRNRKKQERLVVMRAPSQVVPGGGFDRDPSYRIFAGLVFQPLTLRYLEVFEEPPDHLSLYGNHPALVGHDVMAQARKGSNRREVVVLTGVLSSELTRGDEGFEDEVVSAVNGEPIEDLAHLSRILDQTSDEFVRLEVESGGVIVLHTQEARDASPRVLERYRVARDRSGELVLPASLAP
jgi:hypothetical protein